MSRAWWLPLLCFVVSGACRAGEELITSAVTAGGGAVPYILDSNNAAPRYVVILFPGGNGIVNAHIEDGKVAYEKKNNFLLRAREFLVDDDFASATTDATQVPERIQAIIDDLQRRFPGAKVYLMGTSNGTFDTMALAEYLSTRIAGEIHTSSLSQIGSFDGGKFKNRQLVVHHRLDACRRTPFAAAERSHARFGTDFIAMDGGISVGDPCEAFAYHGYNGIERETIAAIKAWIRQDAQGPAASQPAAK